MPGKLGISIKSFDVAGKLSAVTLALMFGSSAAGMAQTVATNAGLPKFVVAERQVEDLKAVFATVQSKNRIEARVRTPGTVITLKVQDGDHVSPGQVLAVVVDPKLALRIRALEAQILAAQSRLATAKADYDRAEQLRVRGVTPQQRVDQLKTAFDVATNDLAAARAERQVSEEQVSEGQVLAPAEGRVLKVPVTEGSVVLAGESIATIAANQYLLRLELPERHARFMKSGDKVRVGARGLTPDQQTIAEGRITRVYPELQAGRVLADAEAPSLGDYFVGERTLVWISAGTRTAIVVPQAFVFKRFGLDYVRLSTAAGAPADVVVQPGIERTLDEKTKAVEILSGLVPGDTLIAPAGPEGAR